MQEPTEEQLSHEELVQKKEEMYQFYTESMRYLEAQYKYEELLLKIDQARFGRIQIQMQHAMMMNPGLEEDNPEATPENLHEEIREEQKERKLRKS